jgi:hypothetical protein
MIPGSLVVIAACLFAGIIFGIAIGIRLAKVEEKDNPEPKIHQTKNQYLGHYLIEHHPSESQPWAVYPLRSIFLDQMVFYCNSVEEAEELIDRFESGVKSNWAQ